MPTIRSWKKLTGVVIVLLAIGAAAGYYFDGLPDLRYLGASTAEPQGMSRKIDGSSIEAVRKSVEKLSTELSPTEFQKFTQAVNKLAKKDSKDSLLMPTAFAASIKAFLNQINGKTPQQIIQLAESLDGESASGTSAATPPKDEITTRLNVPFNIDGIEILITGFHIGKLQKIQNELSFGIVPDKPFLLGDVAMKNTTEGTIIHVQDASGSMPQSRTILAMCIVV